MSGGWWDSYRLWADGGEDYVHQQMREFWVATGQLTAEQGGRPVDADGHRNLSFLASWGYVPSDPQPAVSDASWGGPWVPVAWSQSWVDPGTNSSAYTSWSAGWV